ncbi:MAG: hypothetical protein WA849_11395, partial [Candidatus Udaeobacter sp.]
MRTRTCGGVMVTDLYLMKTNTSPADKPKEFATNSFIQLRTAILTFLIGFMLSCFGLSSKVLAVVPAPD